ncbi:DHA2 family efflux MFS transporter permease subunit [Streptomyces sp. NPDC059740]|uniref:DHA2 family efflux MFS transporter permease subunit n=1 Tax=Streptomyces sp. NPDC059740 TaxID=3346926 RepID=UPI0036499634
MKSATPKHSAAGPRASRPDGGRSDRRRYGPAAVGTVVVLGSLMTVVDTTIVNVALNPLARAFDAPLAVIQWVATAYTLALATIIPVTAWAVARFGDKRCYLVAIALFVAGSTLAGLAWNVPSLIVFRVLQGLGGGMVAPIGMTLVVRAADRERMGRSMAVLGIPVLLGPLVGPVLGGWLVDSVSWRWMFLINIPVGVAVLALAPWILPADSSRGARREPLDLPGLLMLSPGLAAFLYAFADTGGGNHTVRLVVGAVGALSVCGFVARALTARHPLIDLRLLRSRSYAAGLGVMVFFPCAYLGSMLLTPMYYQAVRGESATDAGMLSIPQVLATGITMQIATRLVDRVPPGRVVLSGVGLSVSGMLAFTLGLSDTVPYWWTAGTLAVMGVGVGMTLMPTMTTVTRDLSHDDVPTGSTSLNIVGQLTPAIGTALMSVLLTSAMTDRLPAGRADQDALRHLPAGEVGHLAPRLADSFQYAYVWAAAIMAVALLPALFLPRRRSTQVTPADAGSPAPAAPDSSSP